MYATSDLVDIDNPAITPGKNYRVELVLSPVGANQIWSDYFEIIDSNEETDTTTNTNTNTICNTKSDFNFTAADTEASNYIGSIKKEDFFVLIDHNYVIENTNKTNGKIVVHYKET